MLRNEKGNTLIMVLITFAVIIILGTCLLGRVVYSQNETALQIESQKAYYLTKSTLDAAIRYFEDATESLSEWEGKKSKAISNTVIGGSSYIEVGRKTSDGHLILTAHGTYGNSHKKLSALIKEEKKGLFNDEVVLGAEDLDMWQADVKGNLFIRNLRKPITIENIKVDGKLFLEVAGDLTYNLDVNIQDIMAEEMSIHLKGQANTALNGGGNQIKTLKVLGENGKIDIQNWESDLVQVQGGSYILLLSNKIKQLAINANTPYSKIQIKGNHQIDFASIYSNQNVQYFGLLNNQNLGEIRMGLQLPYLGPSEINDNQGPQQFYIQGVQNITGLAESRFNQPVKWLYSDAPHLPSAISGKLENVQYVASDLLISEIAQEEVDLKDERFYICDKVLTDKDFIDIPPGFVEVPQPDLYSEDNRIYTEYTNGKAHIVLVKPNRTLNIKSIEAADTDSYKADKYYVEECSNKPVIFLEDKRNEGAFTAQTHLDLNVPGMTLEQVYIYMPHSTVQFFAPPEKFTGSVIANAVLVARDGTRPTFEFKSLAADSGLNLLGKSTYSFVKYTDK